MDAECNKKDNNQAASSFLVPSKDEMKSEPDSQMELETESKALLELKTELDSQIIPEAPKQQEVELRYTEPIWARIPVCSKNDYFLEVIKNGTVIERVTLHGSSMEKSYLAIGRFSPPCNIKLDNPSVSRFHSVLQFGELVRGHPQWFIYDMNSTHGVKVNKKRIEKNTFVPLSAGFVFQIAASSRLFVISGGPKQIEDEDQEKSPPEKESLNQKSSGAKGNLKKDEQNKGVECGDDEEEGDAEEKMARFFEKDPLHWLEHYFEREGVPMHFRFTKAVEENEHWGLAENSKKSRAKGASHNQEDGGNSTWICSIDLISDISLTGGTLVSVSAPSKRLAQLQCALLACERLNEACLLQISSLWNKRKTYAENDFYEQDEDVFYDRTGQLEEQREKRRRWYMGESDQNQKAKTHSDLLKELADIEVKIEIVKSEIERLTGRNDYTEGGEEKSGGASSTGKKTSSNFSMRMAISQLNSKEKKLLEERKRLERLVEIAKPAKILQKFNVAKGRQTFEINGNSQANCSSAESKNSKVENEAIFDDKQKASEKTINISHFPVEIEHMEMANKMEEEESLKKETPEKYSSSSSPILMSSSSTTTTTKLIEEEREDFKFKNRESTKKEEEIVEEGPPKFYAPAMPSKAAAAAIAPRFGVLTKEELIQMKLLQRQEERDKESLAGKRRRLSLEAQEEQVWKKKEEKIAEESLEKFSTWMPPEDQSGDGSTRLNRKFAGRY